MYRLFDSKSNPFWIDFEKRDHIYENMSLSVRICTALLVIVCMTAGVVAAEVPAATTGVERPATVIHKSNDRIYLSLGRLAGVSGDWIVVSCSSIEGDLSESLTWIGDDISRFEPEPELADSMAIGDTVWLAAVEISPPISVGGSVRWALTKLPVPVDCPAKTLNDWDFREAVYGKVGEFVERIEQDEERSSSWFLRSDVDVRFSNGRIVSADVIRESILRMADVRQPFSLWMEHFKLVRDTLYCAKANPFKIQTNFPSYCGRSLTGIDWPGFYLIDYSDGGRVGMGYRYGSGGMAIIGISDSMIILCRQADSDRTVGADTVFLQLYSSYEAAKLAFELGEADIVDIAPYDVKRFEDHYEVLAESLESALFLSVNNSKSYFSNNLFSTALNYLIDKESLCRVPLGQMVAPIDYPMELPGVEMSVPFRYDKRKGKRLLRQIEDLPNYLSLFVPDPSDPGAVRTAQYVRGVLKREGISVTVYTEPYKGDEPEDSTLNSSFDMMLARLDDLSGSRAGILYQSFYHEDFNQSIANRSLFHSAECESAFQEFYSSCFESTEEGVRAARRIIYRHLNAPSGVWIYRPVRYIAVSPRVTMPAFLAGGVVDLSGIKVDGQ